MNKSVISKVFILLLIGMLASCSQQRDDNVATSSLTETTNSVLKIDTNIVARGELVPKDVARLAFNTSGQVKSRYVEIGDKVHRGEILVQLDTTTLELDVIRAENVLKIAQTQLNLQSKQDKNFVEDQKTIAVANISIAEADLSRTQYSLKQSALMAPFDGTIVDIQAIPGEMVAPGKTIITLADLQSMQVETLNVEELDISRIFINQPVEIYVEALQLKLDGNVIAIAPQANLLDQNKVYKVTIHLSSQSPALLWGMSAEAKFIQTGQP